MRNIQQVAVYAASSAKVDAKYFACTELLAKTLANNGVKVVYGGGGSGLMGCLADAVLAANGHIKGIIPGFMRVVEWQHNGLSELEIVADMHERKAKFLRKTDAVIALPGGCGTLEELLEVITLKRLGKFRGPIVIVNYDGFYDPLLQMLDRCVKQKFMTELHRSIWTAIQDPAEIMNALRSAEDWESYTIDQAGV